MIPLPIASCLLHYILPHPIPSHFIPSHPIPPHSIPFHPIPPYIIPYLLCPILSHSHPFPSYLVNFFYILFDSNYSFFLVLNDTTILNPCRNIDTKEKPVVFGKSYWILLTLTRSVKHGTLNYYVNDILIHSESVSKRAIPGTGTLRLGHSEMEGAKWYNGFISQLNIYNWVPGSRKQIDEQIQGQHCCNDKLLQGNWLNWTHVIGSWTLHGSARVDKGVECTSFESMTMFFIISIVCALKQMF